MCVCVAFPTWSGQVAAEQSCEGVDPEAMTAAVPSVPGKGLAGCTAPPWGSGDWTTGMGAIWIIWNRDKGRDHTVFHLSSNVR